MPVRNHASAAARPRTRATTGQRRSGRESHTVAQRQQRHTRSSAQGELLETLSDPDKILRKPRRKKASVPQASDNHDGQALEGPGPLAPSPRLWTPVERIADFQAAGSQDSASSVEEDPLESWYTNVGYLIALDQSTIDVLEQFLPLLTMSTIKRKLYKTKGDRAMGLTDRNVQLDPCMPPDPFLTVFHQMKRIEESSSNVYLPDLDDNVTKYHVDEWRLDLEKAIKDELEATFQRTIMMSMLDRFRLMYSLKDGDQPVLDFAVESTWNCPFMPTRALKKDRPDRQRVLARPRPDISIAFHLRSIIEDGLVSAIPESTKRIMIYEAQDGSRTQRAFHFLMIEAKNADKTSTDKDGHLQNLNSASQSLHCLYEFFNEADRQEVECNKSCCTPGASTIATDFGGGGPSPAERDTFVSRFFKEVRVFTAVPTGRGITIRVHRACPASKPPFPSHEGRPPFQLMILPDYPLQFEFNEVIKLTDDNFSRESLVNTFQKIMVDYGIGKLRPLLQQAAAAITRKFYNWEEEKGRQYVLGMRHYSHGQTAPPPSAPASQAVSQNTRWSSRSAASSSRPPSPTREASWSASPHSPVAQFPFSGQPVERRLEPPRKKTRRR